MFGSDRQFKTLILVLSVLTALAFGLSLYVGPVAIDAITLIRSLFSADELSNSIIVQEIRLPRALLGMLVGAALGASGAALQGYVRNPLAEPGLIGVSASAALGAVLVIYSGLSALFALALPIGGIIGGCIGVGVMLLVAGRKSSTLTLILAGVAVTSFAGALTSLALNLAPSPFAALEIVFWLLGSLANRSLEHVWLAAPFIVVGLALVLTLGKALDALTLGEDTASTLGVNLKSVRICLVFGVTSAVGAATAVSGAIGFVGLVVPHVLRPFVGHRPGLLLPASALGGAVLLLISDVIVRLVSFGGELKLGVFTAFVGAPFFLWLVLRMRGQYL